jgi:protein-arginine kinase activator protein McsA
MKCSRCKRHATTGVQVTTPDKSEVVICSTCCRETIGRLIEKAPKHIVTKWMGEVMPSQS